MDNFYWKKLKELTSEEEFQQLKNQLNHIHLNENIVRDEHIQMTELQIAASKHATKKAMYEASVIQLKTELDKKIEIILRRQHGS
jgi:hypothetical protein